MFPTFGTDPEEECLDDAKYSWFFHHLRNDKGTGAEMCHVIVPRIVTEYALLVANGQLFPVPGNRPRRLCES